MATSSDLLMDDAFFQQMEAAVAPLFVGTETFALSEIQAFGSWIRDRGRSSFNPSLDRHKSCCALEFTSPLVGKVGPHRQMRSG